MMQIDQVVGDIILLVLHNHEPLKKIGIEEDRIFAFSRGVDLEKYKDKIRKLTNDFPHLNEKGEVI